MKSRNSRLLAGLILLVIGAAVFVYGLMAYEPVRGSISGAIQRIFNGSSTEEQQALIEMVAGAAVAVIGLVFLFARRGNRR
jgi:multisubunit Na+/H+ antiporter MnhB subunit